jgi:hypothetical protein
MCREFGVLPLPGGLFDQDPRHLKILEKIMEAVHEAEAALVEQASQK